MAQTRSVRGSREFRPSKRLGQHFLRDQEMIRQIISRSRFGGSSWVLEIGPGLGALTLPLARTVEHVYAVEKDPRLAAMLQERLSHGDIRNVSLIQGDILKLDLARMGPAPGRVLQVLGNLPYNISSPFLEKLMDNRMRIERAVLTFQLEFARRLVATPGHRAFGAMSVLIQYHARVAPLLQIPRDAFYPRPKVDSMTVEIDLTRPHPRRTSDEQGFKRIVKAAFAHKRKTLLNSLTGVFPSWPKEALLKALAGCDIEPRARGEALDIDDFLCLSAALHPFLTNGGPDAKSYDS